MEPRSYFFYSATHAQVMTRQKFWCNKKKSLFLIILKYSIKAIGAKTSSIFSSSIWIVLRRRDWIFLIGDKNIDFVESL